MRSGLLLFALLTAGMLHSHAQQKGYYRKPAIYQNTVVFTAEGDLWTYDLVTGVTARLTTHEGLETDPVISPDGKTVAFAGQYEGVTELYAMPIEGGVPRRLTYDFDGYYLHTVGWTPDGRLLYCTSRYNALPTPQLRRLDLTTLASEPVPLSQAADGCYDASGVLFFTRLPNQGSKTKRYKGGFIEQIWRFDGKQEAVNLTGNYDGTSTRPLVYNDRIYFLSDRDGTMNLWSMDKQGQDLKQHSFSKGWDLQGLSLSAGKVVYQKGADIWLYDIATGSEKVLDIRLRSDFDQRKPRWIKNAMSSVSSSDISPEGNYAVFISRGRLFVSPAKGDRWVEVNRRSGIRYKLAHFISEKELAVLSDESGEYEVWSVMADGSKPVRQLTKDTKTMITEFGVSPDKKWLAFTDKNNVLRIIELSTGAVKFEYSKAFDGLSTEFGWSPDSRFLHFVQTLANESDQIVLVDVTTMKTKPITTERLNSSGVAWAADTSMLYFLSQRNLHTRVPSPWGPREREPYYTETSKLYAIPLDSGVRFPYEPTDSWLTDSVYNPALAKAAKHHGARRYNAWDQLYELPVKPGNLNELQAADGYLYWLDYGPEGSRGGAKLMALKLKESKKYEPTEIASGVASYQLSANRKKLLVAFSNHSLALGEANGEKLDAEKTKLELDNWNFLVDPVEDWKELFADAWRMMRDYFYDRNLHKVDWPAVRRQYEPLVTRLTDRYELDDLLGQMVGELSALHTFVGGGDKRVSPDIIPTGFLGALLVKAPAGASGPAGVRIEHIYRSDPDFPDRASPLARPGLHIREGDVITAVNNVPLEQAADIAVLLANKVGVPVKLSLLDHGGRSFEEVVRPVSGDEESEMRYAEWELERRERTDSVSHNDIGYVHLRAMGGGDMDAFVEQFYPVFNRKGLILDVRHNFGGNIDSWVLEKLIRKAWMYWQARSGGSQWNMPYAFRGHMVILCDQVTSSDGEAVTEGFRRLGLGKVIGMRTWGGEIWLSFDNRLVDGGIASAAELGVYGPESKWLIEGHGVEPDIVVDNLPWATFKGKDAQLDAAIDYLTKQIVAEPVPAPVVPAYPDKSFRYEK
jgi:tricorn protease